MYLHACNWNDCYDWTLMIREHIDFQTPVRLYLPSTSFRKSNHESLFTHKIFTKRNMIDIFDTRPTLKKLWFEMLTSNKGKKFWRELTINIRHLPCRSILEQRLFYTRQGLTLQRPVFSNPID